MYRAFEFTTAAGAYWSVIDDGTYETVTVADRFLQYVRFGRGRAGSTTRKYAEAIALYLTYCARRGVEWTDPDLTGFQLWLRVTPPLRRSAASTLNSDLSIPDWTRRPAYAVVPRQELSRDRSRQLKWLDLHMGPVTFQAPRSTTRTDPSPLVAVPGCGGG